METKAYFSSLETSLNRESSRLESLDKTEKVEKKMAAPKMKLLARATTRSSQPAWTELRLELAKTLKEETSKECKVQDKTLSTKELLPGRRGGG